MLTICVILLSPTLLFILARLTGSPGAASKPLAILEWLFDALLLAALTLLIFIPLGRVTVSPWMGHSLAFSYGMVAAAFNVAAAIALGALQGLRRCRWEAVPYQSRRPRLERLGHALIHLLLLLLLVLTLGYLWGVSAYPVVSLEEIAFHLNAPLEGTAASFVSDVFSHVLLPAAALFALFELLVWLPRGGRVLALRGAGPIRVHLAPARRLSLPVALLLLGGFSSLLFSCMDHYLDIATFLRAHTQKSALIEREYTDPNSVAITFPQKKRNLITLYIESGETTFQDAANGGIAQVNYMPEMTRIASQSVSFSQSELIEGAALAPGCGWTMAALIAQTSGLPLKVLTASIGEQMSRILPGATALGDILSAQGYRNVFMAGSDFTFGGRRAYFEQHGGYEVWDLLTARELGLLPEGYYEAWGFEDRKLYAFAKDLLTELTAGDQPFHFSLLTVDTHTPGYVFDCCPDDIDNPYLRTVACASRQLSEFLAWCQAQPFYDETTIVVTGDHAGMLDPQQMGIAPEENDIYLGSTDRPVYNAFINAAAQPAREKNRLFTTLDFFPSVLASIGVLIEGDRLALGTNLFSDRPTLSEEYGYDALFTELARVSTFYNEELLYP